MENEGLVYGEREDNAPNSSFPLHHPSRSLTTHEPFQNPDHSCSGGSTQCPTGSLAMGPVWLEAARSSREP